MKNPQNSGWPAVEIPCSRGEIVDAYLNRSLPPRSEKAFELHLMDCTACLHVVEVQRSLALGITELRRWRSHGRSSTKLSFARSGRARRSRSKA